MERMAARLDFDPIWRREEGLGVSI